MLANASAAGHTGQLQRHRVRMNRLSGRDNVLMLQWVSNKRRPALMNLSDKRTQRSQRVVMVLHAEDQRAQFMSTVSTETCLTWF